MRAGVRGRGSRVQVEEEDTVGKTEARRWGRHDTQERLPPTMVTAGF